MFLVLCSGKESQEPSTAALPSYLHKHSNTQTPKSQIDERGGVAYNCERIVFFYTVSYEISC